MTPTRYSYYGDDFTGSTDVLEALATAGLRSVLFLGLPSDQHCKQFADCEAIGIAGDSRSRSPEWMNAHLPGIFERLRSFGAQVVHYKTCSTFDSSPQTGSIGRALEIGQRVLEPAFVPIVVAAPHLRRYVVFGNLFAAAADQIYRIDRHPTMRQHPVTPMHEADLRRHLAQQTQTRIGLVDLLSLQSGCAKQSLSAQLAADMQAVLFDGISDGDLKETGRLVWEAAQDQPVFAVGSSGVAYSLVSAWQAEGVLTLTPEPGAHTSTAPGDRASTGPSEPERLLVISGSCSPVTERQIKHALANGYAGVEINPATILADDANAPHRLLPAKTDDLSAPHRPLPAKADRSPPPRSGFSAAVRAGVEKAIVALDGNGKVVVYSSLGSLPPGVSARGDALGRQLGEMLREIIRASGVRRVVLAGGDTSSHAVAQLGIYALTWSAAIQPGAPLCRAHSDSPELDGLELVLKGGQVGTDDFFEQARTVRLAPAAASPPGPDRGSKAKP